MIEDKDIIISEESVYKYSDEHDDQLRERFGLKGTKKMKFNVTYNNILTHMVPSFYNTEESVEERMVRTATEKFIRLIRNELQSTKQKLFAFYDIRVFDIETIRWLEEKSGLSYTDLYKVIRQFIYEHQDSIWYDEDDSGYRYNFELDAETTEELKNLTKCIPPVIKPGIEYIFPNRRKYLLDIVVPESITDDLCEAVRRNILVSKCIPDGKELRITNSETIDTDDNSIQLKLTFELKDKGDE